MPGRHEQVLILLVVFSIPTVFGKSSGGPTAPREWQGSLGELFSRIDTDGDGQIEASEAARYIGDASVGDEDLQCMQANVDGADQGDTISEKELQRHLQSLMKGHRVTEWVADAIGLPQYVQVFKDNLITVLDFPLFVNDGGASLKNDLGITSKLHRQQLVRAMKRVILGLGAVPGAPRGLLCEQVSCNAMEVAWQPPSMPGHPPFHKYKLQRTSDPEGQADWRSIDRQVDVESSSFVDRRLKEGSYRYRLTAWNAYGWSKDALSSVCIINAQPGGVACSSGVELPDTDRRDKDGGVRWWALLASSVVAVVVVGAIAHWKGQRDALGRHPGSSASLSSLDGAANEDSPVSESKATPRADPARPFYKTDSGKSAASEGERRVQFAQQGSGPSEGHRQSFGDLAGLDARPQGLAPLRIDSGKARLAFSNPAPTAFPSHTMNDGGAVEQWLDGPSSSRLARNLSDRSGGTERQDSGAGGQSDDDIPETPAGVDRWQCGQAGCHRRFGRYNLRDMKHAMQRHFCCVCQRVFCHHHTSYSPHGPFGSCGMESQCICDGCYATLPRATQERLKKTNKLVKKNAKSNGGGSVGKDSANGEGSAHRAEKSSPNLKALLRGLSGGRSGGSSGTGKEPCSRSGSESLMEGMEERRGSGSSQRGRRRSAAEQWSYARSAVGAVLRFREAGQRRRESQEGGARQQGQAGLPPLSPPQT